MCLEVDRVGLHSSQLLSRHILLIDTFQIYVHCFPYILQPLFTLLGCNTRLHGVPSAWVFVSGMIAEAKAKSFVPQNPLILRDRVPSSFLRPLASCFETRVSPLFEVRVPPVLIEARAASCPRPACLRFSRS